MNQLIKNITNAQDKKMIKRNMILEIKYNYFYIENVKKEDGLYLKEEKLYYRNKELKEMSMEDVEKIYIRFKKIETSHFFNSIDVKKVKLADVNIKYNNKEKTQTITLRYTNGFKYEYELENKSIIHKSFFILTHNRIMLENSVQMVNKGLIGKTEHYILLELVKKYRERQPEGYIGARDRKKMNEEAEVIYKKLKIKEKLQEDNKEEIDEIKEDIKKIMGIVKVTYKPKKQQEELPKIETMEKPLSIHEEYNGLSEEIIEMFEKEENSKRPESPFDKKPKKQEKKYKAFG